MARIPCVYICYPELNATPCLRSGHQQKPRRSSRWPTKSASLCNAGSKVGQFSRNIMGRALISTKTPYPSTQARVAAEGVSLKETAPCSMSLVPPRLFHHLYKVAHRRFGAPPPVCRAPPSGAFERQLLVRDPAVGGEKVVHLRNSKNQPKQNGRPRGDLSEGWHGQQGGWRM